MFTPVNSTFTIKKWGFKGVKIIQVCFRDVNIIRIAVVVFVVMASEYVRRAIL